jgi:hypothetical protein
MAIAIRSIMRLNHNTAKLSFIRLTLNIFNEANMTGIYFIGISENGLKSATHREIEKV